LYYGILVDQICGLKLAFFTSDFLQLEKLKEELSLLLLFAFHNLLCGQGRPEGGNSRYSVEIFSTVMHANS